MTPTQSLAISPAALMPLEYKPAAFIVKAVNLEDVRPEDIDPAAPLIGDGLGLDSIDALEMAIAIAQQYGLCCIPTAGLPPPQDLRLADAPAGPRGKQRRPPHDRAVGVAMATRLDSKATIAA